ncbi:MAG: ATP synthase F0 subunit A [Planctomycetes bacterium RBG_13_62_9]|nr:MAG: ATP synthase F0 subunit A [Planctomycetes bacterium RBG_13_62_9]
MIATEPYSAMLAQLNPLEPVTVVPLFTWQIGPYELVISNHSFMVLVVTALLLLVVSVASHSPKLVPRGLQNLVESICVFVREEVARPIMGHLTDRYVGFLWTTFFFVLTLNLVAMIPTDKMISLVTGHKSHFGGPATANIWITGALAVIVFVMTHVYGIRKHGLIHYFIHLAPPAPKWLLPLVYPLELLSLFVRPFTMAIRLFANIVAGHMVLTTVLGLIFVFKHLGVVAVSVAASVALSFLELLVAFIQAYVFTFLCTLYIGSATSSEH